MTTKLTTTLRREIALDGEPFVVALSAEGIKLTQKGKRNGREMTWKEFWTGDAELAQQLRVSVSATGKDR